MTNNSCELQYIIILMGLKVGCVKIWTIVGISFYGFEKSQLFTPFRQFLGPCMDVFIGWTQDSGQTSPGCSRVVPKPALCRLRVIVLLKINLWPSLRSGAF